MVEHGIPWSSDHHVHLGRLIGELIVYPCSGVRRCCCRRLRRCRRQPFSNISSETAWPLKAKFHLEPPCEGRTKVCINGPGHMTKIASTPIYGKTFKNLLLQNRKSCDHETWHAALGSQVLQSLYKWWPLVDLDLFMARSNLET